MGITIEVNDRIDLWILMSGLRKEMRNTRLFAGSFGNDRAKDLLDKLEAIAEGK